MRLTALEKEALIKVVGGKFSDLLSECGERVVLSLTYHRVKNKEYPALKVRCGSKVRKVHINRFEWEAYLVEKQKLQIEELKKCVNRLGGLKVYRETIKDWVKILRELKEEIETHSVWVEVERLLISGEIKPKELGYFYRKWEGNRYRAEIWDIEDRKLLKLRWTEKEITREVAHYVDFPYLAKEGTTYILSVEPLNLLKVEEEGILLNNRWLVKQTEKELFVNREEL